MGNLKRIKLESCRKCQVTRATSLHISKRTKKERKSKHWLLLRSEMAVLEFQATRVMFPTSSLKMYSVQLMERLLTDRNKEPTLPPGLTPVIKTGMHQFLERISHLKCSNMSSEDRTQSMTQMRQSREDSI